MNIFDIIGPVMVGPSSSHTAGALQIGYIAQVALRQRPARAVIKFHGSFAETYQGHGSDKAVVGGLLGYRPDDARIRTSIEDAAAAGLQYTFETINIPDAHPNTIIIEAHTVDDASTSLVGVSIGGGNIILKSLDGIDIEYTGQMDTLIVDQIDAVGAISKISSLFAERGINIANMRFFLSKKDVGKAIITIETEDTLSDEIATKVQHMENIVTSIYLPKII
ncbi:MAG: L-serine ammonia-lyase, iron-sulfur-dependent subunit beta [Defluviitaleaceae bacterium]|nr:L-serine ammonia-lyase, iron-sulfur-dependent subunit beta [Defluviitaleaceae bacterium]